MVDLLDDDRQHRARRGGHLGPGGTARRSSGCASSTSTSTARTRSRSRCAPASSSGSTTIDETSTTDAYEAAVVAPMRAARAAMAGGDRDRFLQRPAVQRGRRARRARARAAGRFRGGQRAPGRSETNYIADRLQRSLLPPHLPDIRGVDIATRFRPAGDRNEVGGDFYDIFQTGPNRWAITIGDVCGKGADAAAVTALARHTLRATAIRGGESPDELLRTLNDAMLVDNPTDFQFCTVAFAGLELGDGSTRLEVSSGGHPLPIVLRAGGEVESVGRAGHAARRGPRPGPVVRRDRALPRRHAGLLHGRDHRGAHPAGAVRPRGTAESAAGVRGLRRCRDRRADRAEHARRADRRACATTSRWWSSRSPRARVQPTRGEPALTALEALGAQAAGCGLGCAAGRGLR